MAEQTTPLEPILPQDPEPPKKKPAERIADLEAQLAESTSRTQALEEKMAQLADSFSAALDQKLAKLSSAVADPLKAVDTTPARQLGQLMLDDRMSETEILRRVRAMREGKLAPDRATRFRTEARIFPDSKSPLAEKHPGTTIPLRTEVTRDDFSAESLAHHIASGALIPIA